MGLFAPLSTSYLGFDQLFSDLDRLLAATSPAQATYPPMNLYRESDGYSIELALAGFKKSQIRIEHDKKKGLLTIFGDSSLSETEGTGIGKEAKREPLNTRKSSSTEVAAASDNAVSREVIRQSIATRKFTRSFTLESELEVQEASLEDGLLTIRLRNIEAEENKPLLIQLR
jgi:molecular chaperone IbpA